MENFILPSPGEPAGDPFDPARLRLSQDFDNMIAVKKAMVIVPVRKPDNQWFIRVNPDPAWRLETAVLELKEKRETYLVGRELWSALAGEVVPKLIVTAINRSGDPFLWAIRLPGADGTIDDWNRSALEGAQLAMTQWVRIKSNLSLGAYDILIAAAEMPEPVWPDGDFRHLLNVAFKDRFISDLNHPVIRRLRGEL
jgi:hypothetical protein